MIVSNNNFGAVDVIVGTNILKNSKRLKTILFQLLENNEVNAITISDKESESSIKKLLNSYNILPKDDIIKPSKVIPEIEITVNDVKPVVMKNRPIPFTLFKTINNQVQEMIKSNIVETSSSPYNSAIVPIKKPDGSIRLCIDYRLVNQKIKYEDRPLPHITSMFYHMYKKKVFTTIDLYKGYYQLRLNKNSRELTAFSFNGHKLQFKVLPFGLSLAPGLFNSIIFNILEPLMKKYPNSIYLYIDDILIATESIAENIMILKNVFELLQTNDLKININKSKWIQSSVDFLGMTLTENGLQANTDKIKKILNFPLPQSKKELQSFLGLANYLRQFCYKFSQYSKSLYGLLSVDKFSWSENTKQDFVQLKKSLQNSSFISAPNLEDAYSGKAEFQLITDASRVGIAGVLLQKQDGALKIVGMYNRTLRGSEVNYSPTDLEALALCASLEHYHVLLYNNRVHCLTDHIALTYIFSKSNLSLRLLKWSLLIQNYNIKISYIKGKSNLLADCLSRCIRKDENVDTTALEIPRIYKWIDLQYEDEDLVKIINQLKMEIDEKNLDVKDKELGENGLLVNKKNKKIIVPNKCVDKLFTLSHKNHESKMAVIDRLTKKFHIENINKKLDNFLKLCKICLQTKDVRRVRSLRNEKFKRMERAYIDIGHSEEYDSQFLVLRDAGTNFIIARWICNMKTCTIKKTLSSIIDTYGVWRELMCDQQSCFMSEEIDVYMKEKGIIKLTSIPYEHATNGPAERSIRSLKDNLKKFHLEGKSKTEALTQALSKSRVTPYKNGKTPFQLFFDDSTRDFVNILPEPKKNTIEKLFVDGYYKKRPDLASGWSECKILTKINNNSYNILTDTGKLSQRTSNAIKLTDKKMKDTDVDKIISKFPEILL
uniref:RNA-directed DNA polymerase n=1 Tax=Strongyloides papillosus TaxID=174720 RepID=A0A0N5BKC6_STREA